MINKGLIGNAATTTDSAGGEMTIERLRELRDYAMQAQQDQQSMMDQAVMEKHYRDMELRNRPFDETEEFRDFVVWLCGYTERKSPPNGEEWTDLREQVKKIAAKFALQARDRARKAVRTPEQRDLFSPSNVTWGDPTLSTTTTIGATGHVKSQTST